MVHKYPLQTINNYCKKLKQDIVLEDFQPEDLADLIDAAINGSNFSIYRKTIFKNTNKRQCRGLVARSFRDLYRLCKGHKIEITLKQLEKVMNTLFDDDIVFRRFCSDVGALVHYQRNYNNTDITIRKCLTKHNLL